MARLQVVGGGFRWRGCAPCPCRPQARLFATRPPHHPSGLPPVRAPHPQRPGTWCRWPLRRLARLLRRVPAPARPSKPRRGPSGARQGALGASMLVAAQALLARPLRVLLLALWPSVLVFRQTPNVTSRRCHKLGRCTRQHCGGIAAPRPLQTRGRPCNAPLPHLHPAQ